MIKHHARFLLIFKQVTEEELNQLDRLVYQQAPESKVAGFHNSRKGDGLGLVHTAVLTYDSFRKGSLVSKLQKHGLRKYIVCD